MKLNRVHASGIVAIYDESYDLYDLYKNGAHHGTGCTEIVEGPGWKDEKSEIDKLMDDLHENYLTVLDREKTKERILEFAKNYKEQEK